MVIITFRNHFEAARDINGNKIESEFIKSLAGCNWCSGKMIKEVPLFNHVKTMS